MSIPHLPRRWFLPKQSANAPELTAAWRAAPWSRGVGELLNNLRSSPDGISSAEAARRLQQYGRNTIDAEHRSSALAILLAQIKNPLVLILMFAAIISLTLGEWIDASVILAIVVGSALLGFVQEFRASTAIERLRARVTMSAVVLRDGQPRTIPAAEVVPGDIVTLSAGSLIPADGVVIDARTCYVNQAVLTGEPFPVEKRPDPVPANANLAQRTNMVLFGTSVRSGTAQALVVETGARTMFGQLADRLKLRPPETGFERGIRHFGFMLTRIMLVLVLVVFAINVFSQKPPIDSLLFAIALAVGLSPELLPAIISITLAAGAQRMAQHGVIVRRLNAIENFGSMDVLCTDKTGTLTAGVIRLDAAVDAHGIPSDQVFHEALINATLQAGLTNPLDEAIMAEARQRDTTSDTLRKIDEIPYDFVRKRLSIVVEEHGEARLITKGALENVLAICRAVENSDQIAPLDTPLGDEIRQRFAAWSMQGFRVLGVATRRLDLQPRYSVADEHDLTFSGFLLFFDPPKPDVGVTIDQLVGLGVGIKIITGDNRHVTTHVADAVGLPIAGVLTGADLQALGDEALWHVASRTTLFVDVDPNQKERIILALKKTGHIVGYMGDGINDAPALQAADVGISVDTAVDVAKAAADFVLLHHDLDVLRAGIEQGRRTFANTLKYVFTTTSANFGNMFSMAGASLFLPFLPLLAKQILLNNFLSDIPGMTIASDTVDRDWIDRPHRWDIRFIRNFMIVFGLTSSLFDYLTFGMLLLVIHATPEEFRTAWFIESLLTELVIALVVRTRRRWYQSRPGTLLWVSTLAVALLTLLLPYLPFAPIFSLEPLPPLIMLLLVSITLLYVLAAEQAKRVFYRRASG